MAAALFIAAAIFVSSAVVLSVIVARLNEQTRILRLIYNELLHLNRTVDEEAAASAKTQMLGYVLSASSGKVH